MAKRAILVFRFDHKVNNSSVRELEELASAAGYEVAGTLIQTRVEDPKYNIGRGKVRELKDMVSREKADKVIFFNTLKPSQAYNLRKELGIDVIDRYELILEIFAQRAGSQEAKLQIELARLKREVSFAREYINLSKRGELHGFLGGGKYAVDAYYTYLSNRIALIERILEKIRAQKSARWVRRSEAGLYTISLVGYTGAGKSTLFQRMTRESVYIDGKPFATLSTLSRRTKILGYPVIVTDTIGFIDSLPEQLMDAFYTTLGETLLADVVVLVVDASEDMGEIKRKFNASISVLSNLGVPLGKVVIAANKIDLIGAEDVMRKVAMLQASGLPVIPVSAKHGIGLEKLSEVIVSKFPDKVTETLLIPGDGGILEEVFTKCKVVDISGSQDGKVRLVVEGRASIVEKLKARCREQWAQ